MSTADEVASALRTGALVRPSICEACGAVGRIHLHHWDYSKPLDVIPLCATCHRRVHVGSLPEPRTGRVYSRGEAARAMIGSAATGWRLPAATIAAVKADAEKEGRTMESHVDRLILAGLALGEDRRRKMAKPSTESTR